MLTFVYPTAANRADVLDFYAEFAREGTECIGCRGAEDYDRWLTNIHNRITATDLPDGFVQEAFYLCYDGSEMVGVLNLKFTLTPYLLNYGGHIGYAVRPGRQGHGLATRMLRQSLDIARGMGMDKVLLVCDDDNLASEKVIQHCGGQYEDTRYDAEEAVHVKRYWITL